MTEREIQRKSVDAFRKIGLTVLVSSNSRQTSNSKGMPDCIVYDERHRWIALDFKNPDGAKFSKEQLEYREKQMVYFPTSVDDAFEIVIRERKTRCASPRISRSKN